MVNRSRKFKKYFQNSQNKLVSIIIVSWNGLHWLKRCLPSLKKVTYGSIEIIVVDNSSTDGTKEWLQKKYPFVKLLTVQKNLGYAEANNKGYEVSKGKYILFLNNDVEVTPNFITELVDSVDYDDSIAGAQSKILLLDDKSKYDSIGAFLTPTGFLYHYCFMNKEKKKFETQIDLFTPKGACMLFKRSALQSVLITGKLFDPDAFAYYEETDVAHRIWISGKRIIYAPKSIIYHKMGGTSRSMDNAFIQYHSFKNRIASYCKNLSFRRLFKLLFIHLFAVQLFAFVSVVKGKFSVGLAVQKAIIWNIIHVGEIWKKRKIIQTNIRKVSDDIIWPSIYRVPPFSYYYSQIMGTAYTEV